MKTIKKLKSIALVAISMFATSCMDLQPLASLGDDYVWTSASNFQLFANQFYSWDRGFSAMFSTTGTYNPVLGDMIASYSTSNSYSQGNYTVSSTDSRYGTCYTRIYYCNLLLENAADYEDQDEISRPMGEAYFYRAMQHYELVRLYGDAILLTETIDITSDKLYATQDNRDTVMDQIISDFQMAAELLPEDSPGDGLLNRYIALSNLARVAVWEGTWQKFHNHCSGGKYDAYGNFDYTSFSSYDVDDNISNTTRSTELLTIAKNAALEVMNSGKYSLFYSSTLGADSYRCMFFLDDAAQCNVANLGKSANTEYIHIDRHRDGDSMSSVTHTCLDNAWVVTRKMADMYLCEDGLPIDQSDLFAGRATYTSEFQNRDPRMEMSLLVRSQTYWNTSEGSCRVYWTNDDLQYLKEKSNCDYTGYWNRKWGAERYVISGYESMDFPILRYAEVLLSYAEACYELNNSITDSELAQSINLIRARVEMPDLTNSHVESNGLCMREEIRRERTVELYAEGFRYDDIKRWAMGSTEMPGDLMGVNCGDGTAYATVWPSSSNSTVDSNGDIVFRTDRQWIDSKHYFFPLPSDELELNPNLRQTVGWE